MVNEETHYRYPVHIEAVDNPAKTLTTVGTLIVRDGTAAGIYCETCSYDAEYVDERPAPTPTSIGIATQSGWTTN